MVLVSMVLVWYGIMVGYTNVVVIARLYDYELLMYRK
jgi:hypothetical protein